MKRHAILVLLRLLLAVAVVFALPYSHIRWGQRFPGDGQQAFGFVIIFALIGLAAAALYFALGSLSQFFLRRRAVRYTLVVDLGLFVFFAGVLVFGGITSRYQDTQPNKRGSGKGEVAVLRRAGRPWLALPDRERSARSCA